MKMHPVPLHWITFLCIFSLCNILTTGWAQTEVRVKLIAPRWVPRGGAASLRCEHDVPAPLLYKLEFLKSGVKIFQYVRERSPPFSNYSTPGAKINMSLTTEKSITLEALDFAASGLYWCEVSLETPIYTAASRSHDLTVVHAQKHVPQITFGGSEVALGEPVRANCTSAPAHPPPHITWLVNGIKVDEIFSRDLTYRVPMSYRSASYRRKHRRQYSVMSYIPAGGLHSLPLVAETSTAVQTPGINDTKTPAPKCSLRESQGAESNSLTQLRQFPTFQRPQYPSPGEVTQLTVAMSELRVPAAERIELTCVSTIPGYVAPGDSFADVKSVTVAVMVVDTVDAAGWGETASHSTNREPLGLNKMITLIISMYSITSVFI